MYWISNHHMECHHDIQIEYISSTTDDCQTNGWWPEHSNFLKFLRITKKICFYTKCIFLYKNASFGTKLHQGILGYLQDILATGIWSLSPTYMPLLRHPRQRACSQYAQGMHPWKTHHRNSLSWKLRDNVPVSIITSSQNLKLIITIE